MAYNNSGYPYQYQDQQGWTPNYGQQSVQQPSQGQALSQYQKPPQHQQPQVQGHQLQPQQAFSNPPQSPQQFQVQQQYQYRLMQSPDVQYSPRIPQYESGGSPYGQTRQDYSSPRQQYQSFAPQQQHNQYAQTQNQLIASMPQRQLSYPHPQQYQMPSPQASRGVIPSSPQVMMQGYPAQIQPALNQRSNFPSSTSSHMARQIHSQSPVIQTQRIPSTSSVSRQQSVPRQIHSQSPIAQSYPSRTANNGSKQQATVQTSQAMPPDPQIQSINFKSQSVTNQIDKPIQNQPVPSQTVDRNDRPSQATEKTVLSSHSNFQPRMVNQSQLSSSQPKISKSQHLVTQVQNLAGTHDELLRIKTEPHSIPSNTMPRAEQRPEPFTDTQNKKAREPVVKPEPIEELSKPVAEIDYALLLIDLAEEYFDAAYGTSQQGKPAKKEMDLNIFYKLIATGLGCLEVVLKQWRSALQPAVEASVRLRYASILFAETTNTSEAEEVLSKGISQCDKLRLMDFKYNMHHLLARVAFTTNPKAAIKYVGTVIKDAEIQNHIPWIYAFRFLSASLSLQTQRVQDTLQALSQLKVILNLAKSRGDIEVAATACSIEAMTHINRANTAEAIEQAQTALATVRSAENNPNVSKIPQLIIMAYFVDLMCSLFKADSETAYKKMKAMHESMDNLATHSSWTTGSDFLIPVGQQSAKSMPRTSSHGVVVSQQAERTYLKMNWMPKDELYALGNMLGAATVMHKASSDKKCEELLDNAGAFLKVAEAADPSITTSKVHEDLACHLQILKVFASCSRNAWSDAKKELNSLKVKMAGMSDAAETSLPAFIIYLEAMIAQGTGDTGTALVLYNNPMLAPIDQNSSTTRRPPIINDLSTLATLNTILIIHRPNHPQHDRMESLMSTLDNLDTTSPSGNMRGAYYLIRALRSDASHDASTNPILNTKNNLREVLQIAKQTSNSQFSCISLTFMTDRFFKGQVGEQAHKSASTALNLARRGKNDLWTSVAEGLLAACLETRGNSAEAETRRNEALQLAMKLPASMQIADESNGQRNGMSGGLDF